MTTIAAARICQQEEMVAVGPGGSPFSLPPGGNGVGREGGGISGCAQVDQTPIGRDVVHPVRDGTARPSAALGKSWILTTVGSRTQAWPAFLKSPTSSPG